MRKLLTIIALLLLPTVCFANGKKNNKVVINFFLESSPDLGGKMTFKWPTSLGIKHFRQSTEFKTSEIVAQRPFPSPHASTEYGMIFKFDKDAKKRLERLTNNNNGKHLICFINGVPMDMVKIDRPVKDGIICVWRGLEASHVHIADSLVPRIGETKKQWKARLKKDRK